MKILVANLGSTSFKYRLFDMAGERAACARRDRADRLAREPLRGGDRRPAAGEDAPRARPCRGGPPVPGPTDRPEDRLPQGAPSEVSAIAFKAVHGGRISGVQRVTPDVLAAMEEMNDVAPAHNPPYITAMRLLGEKLPEIPLVAAFETDFHRTIPDGNRYYAIPYDWAEKGSVRRYGFHGASHRYIATRTAELLGPDLRIISCHLGGSSSLCAIRDGQSVATSMGFSAQSGLPQNNRVGDFDPFALPSLMEQTGKSLDEVLGDAGQSERAAGLERHQRRHARHRRGGRGRQRPGETRPGRLRRQRAALSGRLSGRTGRGRRDRLHRRHRRESARPPRRRLRDLDELGIVLDPAANASAKGEAQVSAAESRVQIWVMPTNEELIVARQAAELLSEG